MRFHYLKEGEALFLHTESLCNIYFFCICTINIVMTEVHTGYMPSPGLFFLSCCVQLHSISVEGGVLIPARLVLSFPLEQPHTQDTSALVTDILLDPQSF